MTRGASVKVVLVCLLVMLMGVKASDFCDEEVPLTQNQIWTLFIFSDFQIYFVLTIGVISSLLLIVSLLTWIYFPSFSLPSDIIFVILLSSLFDNITLIIEAVYSKINKDGELTLSFVPFCKAIGFFNMLGNVLCLYYNALFCGALAYSIKNTIRKPTLTPVKLHLICFVIMSAAIMILIFTTNEVYPLDNICIYKLSTRSSLSLFFLHLMLTVFILYSLKKFRSKIPQNSFFQKESHFRYYLIYMIVFCTAEAINTILFFIGNISCQAESEITQNILSAVLSVSNCLIVVLCLASALLRLGHPFIISRLKRVLKLSEEMVAIENEKEDFTWVSSIVPSIKGCQVLSFIEAIMINYIQHISKFPLRLNPYHFQRQYSFVIDEHIAEDYIKRRITNRESHFTKRLSDGLTTLKYQVSIFTPEFYSWMFRDQKMNLFSSFDLRKNLSVLKQQSFTEGGKSGQFFFGTFDHKFIFKTIQAEQAVLLLSRTGDFYRYFQKNPESLLIKILGLYRFERKDIEDEVIHLIIMKNVTMSHKSQNKRVYDIKGSEFNRSALKEKRIKKEEEEKLRRFTLKDKDFGVLEKKVKIDPEQASRLKNILKKDVAFLGEIGVMDYSLLIIKREGSQTFQKGEYRSTEQPNIFYHFGIIDYLEQWTIKRKAQRVFKTLITNEQITVNSPEAYSERLMSAIENII